MASHFTVEERNVRGPATHAIVIGVGHYPHLPGGGKPQVASAEGMEQLTSPPYSARAFATWLIGTLNYPDKPLASVSLLVSERQPTPFRNPRTNTDHVVAAATIENIDAALNEWRDRADSATNHRLIFYYCGHGMGKGSDVSLLAANYGERARNPLDGAIDLRYFRSAMRLSKAPEQIYLIDACRVSSGLLLRAGTNNGRTIFMDDEDEASTEGLLAPVFYASLPGVAAYGREREVSTYTGALLQGLNGGGAVDSEGDWRITTTQLQAALNFHLERAMKKVGRAQIPAADNQVVLPLHIMTADPSATAIVACGPEAAAPKASLSWTIGGRTDTRPRTRKGEWVLELPAGMYEFRAEFGRAPWRADPKSAYLKPPYMKIPIKARQ